MDSPCIAVSQYQSSHCSISLPNDDRSSTSWAPWLLNPQWSGQPSNPSQLSSLNAPPLQKDSHQEPFSMTTVAEKGIPNIMEQYRNLMFDFTFPETIDFCDLPSGQLAATHRSTLVAEHGWKLWELAEMLKRISTASNISNLAKSIAKIEASVEEVRLWVEEQRVQQLIQEAGEDFLN
ncbi:hypothetical protein B0J17DRAFT_765232 [Rhizoctonia solani]|nr:hypothetical protein B0J17DRAFT_765232 [Rhizoctonia solani]